MQGKQAMSGTQYNAIYQDQHLVAKTNFSRIASLSFLVMHLSPIAGA